MEFLDGMYITCVHHECYSRVAYYVILHFCIIHSLGKGQLLGILGGSGAGKTTLLNAISGRILNRSPSYIAQLCKKQGIEVWCNIPTKLSYTKT